MTKSIIVAVASNGAIGRDNALLWHIREDMKFFRRTTTGHPVIMGRKTWDSLGGKALPGRCNIVVTRQNLSVPDGVSVVQGLLEAFDLCEKSGADEAFVMGGGQIYAQALALVDKLYVTEVNVEIEDADTFFPEVPAEFSLESRSETMTDPENGLEFSFCVYRKK